MKFKTLIIFWFFAVLLGLHTLMNYSGEEGRVAEIKIQWPQDSKLNSKQKKHLLMFVHPGCSCSDASLSELSRLMATLPELTAQVVFMKTKKLNDLFKNNPLIKKASLIPRTTLAFDPDGLEAKNFGAETSGMTYLYSGDGSLLFAGGLTQARGHEGRSAGVEAIEEHMKGKNSRNIASVFGCEIFNDINFLTWKKK